MQMFHNYQKLTTLRIGFPLLVQSFKLLAILVNVTYLITREPVVQLVYCTICNNLIISKLDDTLCNKLNSGHLPCSLTYHSRLFL